jgi:membrane-bound lytic murein transglycosylase MltF
MLKKFILLSLMVGCCFADNGVLYGTPDNPQINGSSYDVHRVYIEANAGFQPKEQLASNNDSSEPKAQTRVVVKSKQPVKQQPVNFKSDSWASDSKVEKALKQAASEGKLSYVLEEAKKAKVPATVAIVPIVESNYNKSAVSPKGAGGAWQLMPATANDYGLASQDRFDFNVSTQAAIQLLNDLHNEFGNWALAFAAYNCGSSCVRTALKRNPNATDIDELSLPRETKDYVHKIVKLNQIIAGLDKAPVSTNNKGV